MNKKSLLIFALCASSFAYANNLTNEISRLASTLQNLENELGEVPPPVPPREEETPRPRPVRKALPSTPPPLPFREPEATCPIPSASRVNIVEEAKAKAEAWKKSRENLGPSTQPSTEPLTKSQEKERRQRPAWARLNPTRTSEYAAKQQPASTPEEPKPRPKSLFIPKGQKIEKVNIGSRKPSVRFRNLVFETNALINNYDVKTAEELENKINKIDETNLSPDDKSLLQEIKNVIDSMLYANI